MTKTLAIDFDGVLHDHKNPIENKRMGLPIKDAKLSMMRLHALGHTLIIHTVRGDRPDHVQAWLEYYEIPYHEITRLKPEADIYLDDRAQVFTSWDTVQI